MCHVNPAQPEALWWLRNEVQLESAARLWSAAHPFALLAPSPPPPLRSIVTRCCHLHNWVVQRRFVTNHGVVLAVSGECLVLQCMKVLVAVRAHVGPPQAPLLLSARPSPPTCSSDGAHYAPPGLRFMGETLHAQVVVAAPTTPAPCTLTWAPLRWLPFAVPHPRLSTPPLPLSMLQRPHHFLLSGHRALRGL
jgi:hypothetical protein